MLGMAFLALGLTLADPDSDPAYGYRRYGRYGRYYGGYRKYSPYLSGRGYYGKPYPYPYKPGSTIPFPKVAPKIADPAHHAALAAQAAEAARGAHAAHAAHNGGHAAHATPSVPAHPAPSVPAQVPVELSRAVPQLGQRVPQVIQQVPQQVPPQVPQLVQQPQLVPQQVPQQLVPQQVPQQVLPPQVPQQVVPQVPQQVAPQVPQAPGVLPQRVPQRVINQLVRQAIPKLVQAVRKEIAAPVPIAAEDVEASLLAELPELHIAGNGNGDIFRNNFPIQNNVLRAAEKRMPATAEKMPAVAAAAPAEEKMPGKLRPFQPAPAGQGRFPAVVGPQDVSPVVIPQPDSEAVAILQPLAFGALGDTKAPFEPMFEFFGNDLDFNDLVGQNEADVAAMMQTLLMPIDPEQLPKALPAFPAVPSLPVGM